MIKFRYRQKPTTKAPVIKNSKPGRSLRMVRRESSGLPDLSNASNSFTGLDIGFHLHQLPLSTVIILDGLTVFIRIKTVIGKSRLFYKVKLYNLLFHQIKRVRL